MQRTIKTPTETDRVNSNDKAWVTVTMNVNLGNFENIKVESGFSQTIRSGQDPLDMIEKMQDDITPVIESYVYDLKQKFYKRPKKEN